DHPALRTPPPRTQPSRAQSSRNLSPQLVYPSSPSVSSRHSSPSKSSTYLTSPPSSILSSSPTTKSSPSLGGRAARDAAIAAALGEPLPSPASSHTPTHPQLFTFGSYQFPSATNPTSSVTFNPNLLPPYSSSTASAAPSLTASAPTPSAAVNTHLRASGGGVGAIRGRGSSINGHSTSPSINGRGRASGKSLWPQSNFKLTQV
ncbi:hypothetical protein EV360DRAFT_90430, partial [Lentinula raphanica]